MKYLPIILTIGTIILLIRVFRKPIIKYLLRIRVKVRMASLREAIHDADANKEKTGRKNLVIQKPDGFFEPVQKRLMKVASNASKNKNNAKMTPGRKKFMSKKKQDRLFKPERLKEIEEKSLYATN